uniref:Uncharacterized protein n=1 Tax=Tanacetum cinerariifolium TaxID=118510 RepID=A0A6L2KS86_TANCI|nr:hypothetical protein [Tanacetum cinerariifolium]
MENQSDVQNHLVEIQADDYDLLVNSDNENDDMLGYEFKKYSDAKDADGTNHSDMKLIENKEIKEDEEPSHGIIWLKGRVNKDREFTNDEIRSVGDKLQLCLVRKMEVMQEEWEVELHRRGIFIFLEADKQLMKELSYFKLNLTMRDASVNKKIAIINIQGSFLDLVISFFLHKNMGNRQATDERIELLQTQLDNERRERQNKDVLVKKLSIEMTEKDVTPMGAYEVDGTQSSVVVHDKDARIQNKSNGLVTLEKASKCKLWHLKKSNIVALGNNGLKTVKGGVGGFFAWPKNQVVLDEEVTPPTTIHKISDYNSAPKLQSKRKNYVSRETMQRQARTGKSPKALRENRNKEPVSRNVTVETTDVKYLVAKDGIGSDSEVSTCSKSCLKSYETLKEHYDNLLKDYKKSQLNVEAYKTGLEFVEARLVVYKKNEDIFEENIKILKLDIHLRDNALTERRKKLEKAEKERDEIKITLEKFENSSKTLNKMLDSQVNDKYKTGVGYHAVPPPYTRNFMPPKPDLILVDVDEYVVSDSVTSVLAVVTNEAKTSESKP